VSEDTILELGANGWTTSEATIETQLQAFSRGEPVQSEALINMADAIAADGVTVPFRAQPKTSKGRLSGEVKLHYSLDWEIKRGETVTFASTSLERCLERLTSNPAYNLKLTDKASVKLRWIFDGARGFGDFIKNAPNVLLVS